ncbi:hypothetical protein GOP47_0024103 [Adiantum capillus-veneris]|uniref:MSP domain-containing protein n=1 Tax=Adiantum capillus-veneris TaxID=13818 RepID=A0A9D4Z3Z5_ADICA|nr:hypothetical protein GOP47_0024103 [Adiantum capillus-veneris]
MDRLVIIEPKLLIFKCEIGEKACASFSLRNVMYTMPIAFAVQTSSPTKYIIKPPLGIISPLGTTNVEITAYPLTELPNSLPYCSDKFVVKSVVVPGGKDNEVVSPEWFTAKKKQVFSDHGLRLIFIGGGIVRKLVANGALDELREVLEIDGTLLDVQDEHGCTAMHVAVAMRRPEIVLLLLEFMANLEVKNELCQTALHEAAAHGELLIAELLLARGAATDARNPAGWTPLHSAVMGGHAEMVRLLARNDTDLDAISSVDGRTALHMAVDAGMHSCLEILLENGAHVDANDDEHRETPLHRAAAKGDKKAMEILLQFGANRLARDRKRKTPADIARAKGHPGFLLLDELRLGDDLGMGSRQGRMEAVQETLTRGASIDGADEHGWRSLHRAAFRGHTTVASMLLDEGADVKSKDVEGYTPLHCAIECGHKDMVMLLLQHGALVEDCTVNGQTTVDLATLYGYTDIAELLLNHRGVRQGAGKQVLQERVEKDSVLGTLDATFYVDLSSSKSSVYAKDGVPSPLNRKSVTFMA